MADISKIQLPNGDEYNLTDKSSGYITGMTILNYGKSTWADFIAAYTANKVVYCRASSNSNPASGSQTRLAFMAYVNNAESPTNVEFQYYRSVNAHSDSQQGDQVYVYKLTSSNSWTVTVREAYTKIVAGGDLTSVWADGALTISADLSGKQDLLVSGTNIKTVNSESLLGSGNIDIEGVPHVNLTQAEYDELTPEEKNNGDIYFITDSDDGGGPVSEIIGTGSLDTEAQTLIGGINEVNSKATWGEIRFFTLGDLYHCTGTKNGSIKYRVRSDNRAIMFLPSRFYISSFSRTGGNPGVYFTNTDLPNGFFSRGADWIGLKGESATELAQIVWQDKIISVTETLANVTGTRLTFTIFPCIIELNT